MKIFLIYTLICCAYAATAQTDSLSYKQKQDLSVQAELAFAQSFGSAQAAAIGAFYKPPNAIFGIGATVGYMHTQSSDVNTPQNQDYYAGTNYLNSSVLMSVFPDTKRGRWFASGGVAYNLFLDKQATDLERNAVVFKPFYWSAVFCAGHRFPLTEKLSLTTSVNYSRAITPSHIAKSLYSSYNSSNRADDFVNTLGISVGVKYHFTH